jgi:hypothetical protein
MACDNQVIRFRCPSCSKGLKARNALSGSQRNCPACANPIKVPRIGSTLRVPRPAPRPAALSADEQLVPLEIALPRNMGGMKALVSRKDAGILGHTLIGGLVALAGVLLCACFGLRFPKGRC